MILYFHQAKKQKKSLVSGNAGDKKAAKNIF